MKNWKTTLAGVLSAAFLFGYKLITHQPITVEDITIASASIGVGSAAKDSNVTGGTVQQ